MVIPEILPNELGEGYLIRLSQFNGYSSRSNTVSKLISAYPLQESKEIKTIPRYLAAALGISSEQFYRMHTLLPISRAVVSFESQQNHGEVGSVIQAPYHGSLFKDKVIKSCPLCINEDVDYWGFPYFRREHQFPGLAECSKHGVALNASMTCEHRAPDAVSIINRTNTYQSLNNPVIESYTAILDYWSIRRPQENA